MERDETYIIPLREMPLGTHNFEFHLDDSFFEKVEGPEVSKGTIDVELTVKKTAHSFELKFHSQGEVYVPCDRCLEDMLQPIDTENELMVKFGDEFEEVDDTLIVVPELPGEIDLSWYMYEFVALDIPIRHVHPAGECSEGMVSQLRSYLATDSSQEDDDEEDDFLDVEDGQLDEERPVDPRWEALRKLMDSKS